MNYYARFEQRAGLMFRYDTRIYLSEKHDIKQPGLCIGAIVAKNPGSAKPERQLGELAPIALSGDKLLPFVRNCFLEGYVAAQLDPPQQAFVQIWNLFYLCNKNLDDAIHAFESYCQAPTHEQNLHCKSEASFQPLLWYAWGGDDKRLESLKKRFYNRQDQYSFYINKVDRAWRVHSGIPETSESARHTQGMSTACPVGMLRRLLSAEKLKGFEDA